MGNTKKTDDVEKISLQVRNFPRSVRDLAKIEAIKRGIGFAEFIALCVKKEVGK